MNNVSHRLGVALKGFETFGPVSPSRIESAERSLGLLFPPSYRLFLERYGAAIGSGVEIFGLAEDLTDKDSPPMWSDVVTTTKRFRPTSLPQASIAISHDGASTGYFLKCSESDSRLEGAIVAWGPAYGGGSIVAPDFVSFLEREHDR